jgi:dihydroflavonol-4-reductase
VTEPVLVTGGSGIVGRALVERLVADGRRVRALARTQTAEAIGATGAEPVPGDVLDLGSLVEAMRGCSTVFHVAGVNAMCLRDPSEMLRTNVEGSANAVRAAAAAGVARFVYTSSSAAIGEASGSVGLEDSPHRGSYLSLRRSKHLRARVLETAAEVGSTW